MDQGPVRESGDGKPEKNKGKYPATKPKTTIKEVGDVGAQVTQEVRFLPGWNKGETDEDADASGKEND